MYLQVKWVISNKSIRWFDAVVVDHDHGWCAQLWANRVCAGFTGNATTLITLKFQCIARLLASSKRCVRLDGARAYNGIVQTSAQQRTRVACTCLVLCIQYSVGHGSWLVLHLNPHVHLSLLSWMMIDAMQYSVKLTVSFLLVSRVRLLADCAQSAGDYMLYILQYTQINAGYSRTGICISRSSTYMARIVSDTGWPRGGWIRFNWLTTPPRRRFGKWC